METLAMKIRPLHDRVIVKRMEEERKVEGDELLVMREEDIMGVVEK
jgi:co-chaperonin GroES (HSP10)